MRHLVLAAVEQGSGNGKVLFAIVIGLLLIALALGLTRK
jgi:uncharacterized membrane protein YtjA (UPF0391 family)